MPIALQFDVGLDHLIPWVERLSQPACILDAHGRVLEVNQPLLIQTGWERRRVMNQSYRRWLVLPKDTESDLLHHDGYPQKMFTLQGSLLSSDQPPRPASIQWISGGNDEDGYHLLILYPALKGWGLLQQCADSLVTDLPSGIILLDADGKVEELNPAAQRLTGVNRHEVLRQPIQRLLETPVDVTGVISALLEKIHNGTSFRDQPVTWKVGEDRLDVRMDHQPLGGWSGRRVGAYCLIRDMTQLESLEMQVRRSDRLAMIGQIAAGTAHEIRNPLTSIRGFLQVMKHAMQEKGELKEQGYTEIMLREIDRINNLVGEFLLLSRSRTVRMHPVQVEEIWRDLLPIIENEAILHNTEVQFRVEKRPSLPCVKADKELLKQVFLNLCKNGIEAMADGGLLSIRVYYMPDQEEIAIEVRDTGPGIPPHVVDKIFDPFFTTKENGTGLGLSVCKRILQDIGGKVDLLCHDNGTTFTVRIPILRKSE